MSEERNQEDLPERRVTINQVIGYNVAYFRRERGMTQEGLGQRLEAITGRPWSKATVSAVERSWDGNRIRQFDADEVVALSRALGYPVLALFLPPKDDGATCRYLFRGAGTELPMGLEAVPEYGTAKALLQRLFMSDEDNWGGESAYIGRLDSAFRSYFGGIPSYAIYPRQVEWPGSGTRKRARQLGELQEQVRVLRALLRNVEQAAREAAQESDRALEEIGEPYKWEISEESTRQPDPDDRR